MESAIGKTIARVESEGYGETIYFTDGTAIQVTSGDGHYWKEFGRGERQREIQGKREAARLVRLQREEWLALPKEEQEERERIRRSKMGPFALAFEDVMKDSLISRINDLNRSVFGSDMIIPVAPKRRNARRS